MMRIDLQRKFARRHELRDLRAAFSDVETLSAHAARDLLPFLVAIIFQQRGEPVVGVLVHAHLAFPARLQ